MTVDQDHGTTSPMTVAAVGSALLDADFTTADACPGGSVTARSGFRVYRSYHCFRVVYSPAGLDPEAAIRGTGQLAVDRRDMLAGYRAALVAAGSANDIAGRAVEVYGMTTCGKFISKREALNRFRVAKCAEQGLYLWAEAWYRVHEVMPAEYVQARNATAEAFETYANAAVNAGIWVPE